MTIGVGSALDPEESADASFTLGQTTSEGGRFHLLRHHARGGIGMVFVAMDSELHREVALKQIQTHHADDPTSRARFLLEAEVTGRLEHPGVVPVYGLGTNDQGRPFYAMRFVRGESLKEAIERFHRADAQFRPRSGRAHPGPPPAPAAVHRRLQRDRLRPQPGRDPPRPEAGQYPAGPLRRDPGRRLGARPRSWAATTRRPSRRPR